MPVVWWLSNRTLIEAWPVMQFRLAKTDFLEAIRLISDLGSTMRKLDDILLCWAQRDPTIVCTTVGQGNTRCSRAWHCLWQQKRLIPSVPVYIKSHAWQECSPVVRILMTLDEGVYFLAKTSSACLLRWIYLAVKHVLPSWALLSRKLS